MRYFTISGNIVDIINERIYPGTIKVENNKIVSITPEPNAKYNQYIMPGFIDSHVHIESSMLVPSEFARIAVTHGTVATVSDPHEIANVLGMEGIQFMLNNGASVPFKFYFGAPSCVPATNFETAGSAITSDDIRTLFSSGAAKYLSEMMNYPGVLFECPDVIEKIKIAQELNRPIDGHAPGLTGDNAKKYIDAGIVTDHECYSLEEALEKLEAGMMILIREGSAAKNFDALHSIIDSHPMMCMLCSDDKHPDDLAEGHINQIVKKAVAEGNDIMNVLKAATLNPVMHYKLDVGLLMAGDDADFIVVDNLRNFNILKTYIRGKLVADNGSSLIESVKIESVNNFNATKKRNEDFVVYAKGKNIRVIEAFEGQLLTNEIIVPAKIENGCVISDLDSDILKIAVINRYSDVPPALAFIKNFGLKRGAIASSVAHDSHNIIAVGTNVYYLCRVVNALIESKGGMAVAEGNRIEILPLPVAGLMSGDDGWEVAEKYKKLDNLAKHLGSKLNAPFMTLSFMALLVIPKLKLSDKGLFDGENFRFVDLFVE
ncbi:MAG: adenine deaminase [Bacteroidota bacterium]|nr:adenine deaminase [Bacteroidota bacterium]